MFQLMLEKSGYSFCKLQNKNKVRVSYTELGGYYTMHCCSRDRDKLTYLEAKQFIFNLFCKISHVSHCETCFGYFLLKHWFNSCVKATVWGLRLTAHQTTRSLFKDKFSFVMLIKDHGATMRIGGGWGGGEGGAHWWIDNCGGTRHFFLQTL